MAIGVVALLAVYGFLIQPGLRSSTSARGGSEAVIIEPAGAPAGSESGEPRIRRADRLIGCIERADGHVVTIDRCHTTFAFAAAER